MKKRKLLSLDDLCDFYSNRKYNKHFSSKDSDEEIVVQIDGVLNFEDTSSNHEEGLTRVILRACHTGINNNRSSVSYEVMSNALPSFTNRPILGYVWKDEDSEYQFEGHNSHIEEDEDGNSHIEYDEVPVGVIPESCGAKLEYDEENDKYFVIVEGVIFDDYSHALEIIKRENELSVSVELSLRDFSYNAQSMVLEIEDFYFSGVTILGKSQINNELIKPGMSGSNIKIKDFSKSNNSLFAEYDEKSKLVELLQSLEDKLDGLAISDKNNIKKGGTTMPRQFEEEVLAEDVVDVNTEDTDNTEETVDVDVTPSEEESVNTVESSTDDSAVDSDDSSVDTYEVNFSLTLDEITWALHCLVNETYSSDGYYGVDVYEDGYVIMRNYDINQNFRQAYSKDGGNISLEGERVEVFAEYLTSEEKSALQLMRSTYKEVTAKLAKYEEAESIADKMTVFEDVSYGQYLDTIEFKELMTEESVKKFSKEELKDKADLLFAKLVKTSGKFSLNKSNIEVPIKKSPTMFAFAQADHKCDFLEGLLKR